LAVSGRQYWWRRCGRQLVMKGGDAMVPETKINEFVNRLRATGRRTSSPSSFMARPPRETTLTTIPM